MESHFKNQESVAQISEDTGFSRSHLYLLEDKYNEDPTMADKRREGRPPKVDDRLKRRIIREIKKKPFESSYEIMNSINQGIKEEEKICSGIIRSTSLKDGLIASRPLSKPFLTEEHINLRLDFAKKFQNKTSHFWMNVIFMDESFLRLVRDDSRLRVRRRQGESLQEEHIVASFKHGGGGVMFWGCVSWYGVGPLVPIEGAINGKTYGDILAHYIPQVTPYLLTTSPYIIEDGPKVHKTKYVLDVKMV